MPFDQLPEIPPQLHWLGLDKNKIRKLPSGLFKNQSIRHLTLSHNQIAGLPEDIGHMQQLEQLVLSHNALEELPKQLSALTSLNRLDLRYNRFRRFPQILLAFPDLKIDLELKGENPGVKEKVVFLEGNPIEDVPREVMEKGMKSVRAYLSAMDEVV
jgi:Leucine-rich repeat (LRR) protein